jgi:hypothetical protein
MPLSLTIAQHSSPLPGGALAPTGPASGPPPGGGAATGGPTGRARDLGFPSQGQEENNWCWAAVAVGVSRHYATLNGGSSTWTQCGLATDELHAELTQLGLPTGCCPSKSNPGCDRAWYLHTPLTRVGHYHGYRAGAPDFRTEVMTEIDARRPIAVRVEWPNSGTPPLAHFVVISGYEDAAGGPVVQIDDPAPVGLGQQTKLDYAVFVALYQGSGFATHALWTTP